MKFDATIININASKTLKSSEASTFDTLGHWSSQNDKFLGHASKLNWLSYYLLITTYIKANDMHTCTNLNLKA